MNRKNKIISAVAVSTLVVSNGLIVMANNTTNSARTEVHGNLLTIEEPKEADYKGNYFDLKMQSSGIVNGFYITLDIDTTDGVEFDSNSYILPNYENTHVAIDVAEHKSNENIVSIKVAVTSDKNITKDGSLYLGRIKVAEGVKKASYIIDHLRVETVTALNESVESNNVSANSKRTFTLTEDISPQTSVTKPEADIDPEPPTESEKPGTGGDSENNKPDTENPDNGGTSGGSNNKPEEDYDIQLLSMEGKDRYETSTKISKTGWASGAKNVVIVNGNEKNMVDGLSATPFASLKNAPVLLSNGKTLPASTISELKRLNPTNVYVIGGTASMPESVVSSIKSNTKATVTRIGGSTRYETSLAIAKQIDKIADVNKVYISSGTGEVDALSIASVAGREKAPILLTNVNSIDNKTYDFIKSESIKDAYFIGGDKKISDSVINQIDKVVSADVSKNRVAGRNRKDTNAAIIKKFYTGSKLNGVVVSKDDVIIDALTVGSFAAKNDMPVVIGKDSLSTAQKNVLASKNTEKVYQAGGGVKTSVINNLKELLGTKK